MIPSIEAVGPHQLELPALSASSAPPTTDDPEPSRGAPATLGFGAVLDAIDAGGAQLERAQGAENAFISGTGGVQEMVFERAKADALVSVAAAAASRVAQSVNTLTQMQL
jgi:hypothetical protein